MEKNLIEAFQKVAKMLEDLANKYNIPMQEMEPIAKACGSAIAAQNMQGKEAPATAPAPMQEPGMPMDTGADELVGALSGR